MENTFGITREDVLNLAAQKLVEAYCGDPDLSETAERIVRDKINEVFAKRLNQTIDEALQREMEKILGQEIMPVDIWGERTGNPTTIRAQLALKAKQFWEIRVDNDGREMSYGTPRSEILMKKILKDEFTKAIKENADVILAEFKTAIKADATRIVSDHIDKLITLKSR